MGPVSGYQWLARSDCSLKPPALLSRPVQAAPPPCVAPRLPAATETHQAGEGHGRFKGLVQARRGADPTGRGLVMFTLDR